MNICPLCQREIPPELESKHHLTPVLKGGKKGAVAILHTICHGKIHSLLTESELARHYNSIEALLQHEAVAEFVSWVQKRPIDYRSSNRSHSEHAKPRRRRRR